MSNSGFLLACGAVGLRLLSAGQGRPAVVSPDLTALAGTAVNRSASVLVEGDRRGLRLSERPGQGVVWVPDVLFRTGTIEVDVRGEDVFQGSFVGIAFHAVNDSHYEVVYLRPFNFRAEDPVRRSHAIQYAVHPELGWQKLRTERPGEFESGIAAAPHPNEWVRLRIEVSSNRVRAFVGDSVTPSLNVRRISAVEEGPVGIWVGEGSGGDFANLRVEARKN